jgi:hypothetical protein
MAFPKDKPPQFVSLVEKDQWELSVHWSQWFNELLTELHQGSTPPSSIVVIDPSVVDVTTEFPASRGGLGRVGGPYEWWALCDGNNGTPDLGGTELPGAEGLLYIMRTT